MRVESSYPAPIQGVSTFAPRNRPDGFAGVQENFRSDPLAKLTRRPSMRWITKLIDSVSGAVYNHSYTRRGKEYRILIESDGTVHGFVDNVAKVVTGNVSGYVTDHTTIAAQTINDTTFVIDEGTKVEMLEDTDEDSLEQVQHINIKSALNYDETVTLVIKDTVADTETTVAYTSLKSSDTDPDESRMTSKVAEELAIALNADTVIPMTAINRGSCVGVWNDVAGRW